MDKALAKVTHIQKDKASLINDLNSEFTKGNIKQLIIIIETNDGQTMSGFSTDSFHDEVGLLEMAKLDSLHKRGLL